MYAGPGGNRGVLTAWDPVRAQGRRGRSRRTCRCGAGRSPPPATWCSTARSTAGSRRSTRASGKLLWKFKTESGIIGQPISYRGPDGRQYVAIYSGVGGWVGGLVSDGFDPGDPTGGLGIFNAVQGPARQDPARREALCLRPAALACCCSCALAGCDREARDPRGSPLPESAPLVSAALSPTTPTRAPAITRTTLCSQQRAALYFHWMNCNGCHSEGGGGIGPGADGRQVALRQLDGEHRPDDRQRPSERHAGVRRQDDPAADLAGRRVRSFAGRARAAIAAQRAQRGPERR